MYAPRILLDSCWTLGSKWDVLVQMKLRYSKQNAWKAVSTNRAGRISKPPPSASRPPLRRDLRGFYCSSGSTFSQLRVYPCASCQELVSKILLRVHKTDPQGLKPAFWAGLAAQLKPCLSQHRFLEPVLAFSPPTQELVSGVSLHERDALARLLLAMRDV